MSEAPPVPCDEAGRPFHDYDEAELVALGRCPSGLWRGFLPAEVEASQAVERARMLGFMLPDLPPPPLAAAEVTPKVSPWPCPACKGLASHLPGCPTFATAADIVDAELRLDLYLGAYAREVLAGVPGAEVRVRSRAGGLIVQANLYREGGDRVHDSHKLYPVAELKTPVLAWKLGAARGRHSAEVLAIAARVPR